MKRQFICPHCGHSSPSPLARRAHLDADHPLLPALPLPDSTALLPIEKQLRQAWARLEAAIKQEASLPVPLLQPPLSSPVSSSLEPLRAALWPRRTGTALFAAASSTLDCKHALCRFFQQVVQTDPNVSLRDLTASAAPQLQPHWLTASKQKYRALTEQLSGKSTKWGALELSRCNTTAYGLLIGPALLSSDGAIDQLLLPMVLLNEEVAVERVQHYMLHATGLQRRSHQSLRSIIERDMQAGVSAAVYMVGFNHVNHKAATPTDSGSQDRNQQQHAATLAGQLGLDHNLVLVREGSSGMVCQSYYNQYTLQQWLSFDQPLSRLPELPAADVRTSVLQEPHFRGMLNTTQMVQLGAVLDSLTTSQWCADLADKYAAVTGVVVPADLGTVPVLVGVSVSQLECSMLRATTAMSKLVS